MAGGWRNPRTVMGYSAYEVISALQKAVRRGQLDNAMFWATELDLSGYNEWLWRRIKIMVVEDVGPAWPDGPAVIEALYQSYRAEKDKQGSMFTYAAIVWLARAPKNRIVDHAMTVHWTAHHELGREIPDEAYDKHTQKGKSMGRDIDHFLDEAAATVDKPDIPLGVVQDDDPEAQVYRDLERKVLKSGMRNDPNRIRPQKRGPARKKEEPPKEEPEQQTLGELPKED